MANRFVPNRRGIVSFLRTPETRALIERKVRAVEAAASANARSDGWRGEFRTDVQTGDHRVRGAVIGDYSTPYPRCRGGRCCAPSTPRAGSSNGGADRLPGRRRARVPLPA